MAEVFTPKDGKPQIMLVTSTGMEVDISMLYVQLQIYQDIFSSTLSGDLLLMDGMDLMATYGLSGNDYLIITLRKPPQETISRIFRIYKISSRNPGNNSAQKYIIHFCSEERMISIATKMSRAYKGARADAIIADVVVNVLKVNPKRIVGFEGTSGTYDIVVPYFSPLEVIQWATSRAYDEPNGRFCYFFFESLKGFSFLSLQTLYKQKPVKSLKYDAKKVDSSAVEDNLNSMDKVTIINDFDTILSTMNGGVTSRVLGVDLFKQNHRDYNYTLQIAALTGRLLNPFSQINVMPLVTGNTNMQEINSHFVTYVQFNDTVSEQAHTLGKWLLPRALHLASLGSFRIQVVTPGDLNLKVGDIVDVTLPKQAETDRGGKQIDEYKTGKYLVTAVNHKFTNDDKFETIMELSSDSYSKEIPIGKDLSSLIRNTV